MAPPSGTVSPLVGEKLYACRGIFNGILFSYAQKEIPLFQLYSPLVGDLAPRRANPGSNPDHGMCIWSNNPHFF